jgi:hypothetical protein
MNGGNMTEQQLYHEEREKARGSLNRGNRGPQMTPSPRYGPPDPRDPRFRNGNRGDRHTVDRERFPRYNEPDGYEEDDDIEEPMHVPRRDRMRERDREMAPQTPQQNRHMMRYSEDRQMNGSPRYQRAGVCKQIS